MTPDLLLAGHIEDIPGSVLDTLDVLRGRELSPFSYAAGTPGVCLAPCGDAYLAVVVALDGWTSVLGYPPCPTPPSLLDILGAAGISPCAC